MSNAFEIAGLSHSYVDTPTRVELTPRPWYLRVLGFKPTPKVVAYTRRHSVYCVKCEHDRRKKDRRKKR
jgi:hypothetical protein